MIRTIKECIRAVVSYQPYMVLPKPMVIHIFYFAVLWLNTKHNTLGISQLHSPRESVTKRKLEWEEHCTSGFGDFVKARYERNVTNIVSDMHTYDGIYLGPASNWQVTVNVFDLETGKFKNLTRLCLSQSQTA